MTGGQYSPTTPKGAYATTAPMGMVEPPFDISQLAIGAGASFVARTTSYHVTQMEKLMVETFKHKGFSMLEIISGCNTGFGRKNNQPTGSDALEWQKSNGIPKAKYDTLTAEEKAGKFSTGILHNEVKPEYIEVYDQAVGLLK